MAINMDLMGPREGEEEIFERECLIFDAEIEANRRLKRQQVKTENEAVTDRLRIYSKSTAPTRNVCTGL